MRCPECGFDNTPESVQKLVDEWFASPDGLFLRGAPARALLCLEHPRHRQIALRRTLIWVVLPSLALLLLVYLLSCTMSIISYERWWENPSQPGVRHDVDSTAGRLHALGGRPDSDQPHLPSGKHGPRVFSFRKVRMQLGFEWQAPSAAIFADFFWFLLLAAAGRLAAWIVFAGQHRTGAPFVAGLVAHRAMCRRCAGWARRRWRGFSCWLWATCSSRRRTCD
jgi:hypothetical protein